MQKRIRRLLVVAAVAAGTSLASPAVADEPSPPCAGSAEGGYLSLQCAVSRQCSIVGAFDFTIRNCVDGAGVVVEQWIPGS